MGGLTEALTPGIVFADVRFAALACVTGAFFAAALAAVVLAGVAGALLVRFPDGSVWAAFEVLAGVFFVTEAGRPLDVFPDGPAVFAGAAFWAGRALLAGADLVTDTAFFTGLVTAFPVVAAGPLSRDEVACSAAALTAAVFFAAISPSVAHAIDAPQVGLTIRPRCPDHKRAAAVARPDRGARSRRDAPDLLS